MRKVYALLLSGMLTSIPMSYAQTYGKPEDPTNLRVIFDSKTGNATYLWDAPKKDVNGVEIPKENLRYILYDDNGATVAQLYEPRLERFETTSEYAFPVTFALRAQTYEGTKYTSGNVVLTDYYILADPCKLPIAESFGKVDGYNMFDLEGTFTGNEVAPNTKGNLWQSANDKSYTGVTSQDGDNGYTAGMINKNPLGSVKMVSRLFTLENTDNPVFLYHVLHRGIIASSGKMWDGVIYIDVQEEGSGEWKEIHKWTKENEKQEWMAVEVPLTEYKNKIIRLQIRCQFQNVAVSYMLDNFRIFDKKEKDMAVSAFTAPKFTDRFGTAEFRVRVHNYGVNKSDNYDVVLYRDGKPVKKVAGKPLEPYTAGVVNFSVKNEAYLPTQSEYYVKVECAGDQIESDDATEKKVVTIRELHRPQAKNLTATSSQSGIKLNWDAPELTASAATPVTESFEDLDLFECTPNGFGEWKTYDGDGLNSAFSGADSNFPTNLRPKAYTVFNNKVHGFGDATAHSGEKFLISTMGLGSQPKADWLISPALSGDAQKISFYVRSVVSRKSETFAIMVSSATDSISDFKQLDEVTRSASTTTWTKVEVDLPEGTRYFAIVANSKMVASSLEIDDVTYIPEVIEPGLKLVGYNVYRNGEKLNAEPVSANEYTDSTAPKGEHIYTISAVYNNGESMTCESVTASSDGNTGVSETVNDEVVSSEYYTLEGIAVPSDNLQPGKIYLQRNVYGSGVSRVTKTVGK